ncbi:uncharacterized protein MAM_07350 [Metarhizium album ARSEF 1941]|uniref:Tat pathway signal sequence n=1 Tax=Metarhizium album (strain ARSEF 1941) TaxID=1081103 RepID=A0A0B2WM88_METAS|nr:uncharacterized protein MAM_07350 [Metarhizium album ARSEF 1941]KHN94754.1 hypothetical protein MAM_07350 [Metarhizium album ARSEF 1941]
MSQESKQHLLQPGGAGDSEDDPELSRDELLGRRKTGRRLFFKSFFLVSVLAVACICSFWAGTQVPMPKVSVDAECAAHTTQWSPVLRDVAVSYETQVFNGSFMRENIYRQQGSPEVDEAWEDLGVDYRAGIISYEDGLRSGLQPSFVQRAAKYGGGFLVNVEGMHHLHCLNLVRKSLYFNYDYYKQLGKHEFVNGDAILRPHITHCLDVIRQVLMCNVDTGVLGQVWANSESPFPFPDFNTNHKCKNYGDVREWAMNLQRPPNDEIPADYLAKPRPGDVFPLVP